MKRRLIIFIWLFILAFSCKQEEYPPQEVIAYKFPALNILADEEIGWESKGPCKITYTDAKSDVESLAQIKNRGGMSSRYYKHSYSLELNNKFSLGGLPINDDYILNANYIDKTFMRHKVSYDIFRQMSKNNVASKSAYVNVSVNSQYQGLYLLMEEINASMVGLNKMDTCAMLFKDPPVFYAEKLPYVQDSLNYYQQKYPKKEVSDKTLYMDTFRDFLFNSSDSLFAKDIGKWVDIENVIDWHLMLLFSNNADGILKNFYLYKLNAHTPFRFAIWDYDHSFGRDGDNELNMGEKELTWRRSILLKRLSQQPQTGYLPKLKKRWVELRKLNIFSYQNFKAHVEQNHQIISQEVEENFALWPVDDPWYFDGNNYQQEIDLMLGFVERRVMEMDLYIGNLD